MIYDKEKVKTYKKIIKQQNKDKKAKKKLKKIEHKKRLKYCNEIVKLLGNYFDAGVKGYYIDLNGVDIIINSGKCAHGKIKNLQDANWEKFKELVSAKIDEVMEKVLPKEIIKPLCAKCKTELRGDFCHKCGWTNAPYDGIKEDVLLKSFRDNCMYNYAGKMGIDSIKARSVGARFEPIEIHPSVDRVKCKDKPHGWIQWKRTDVCMDIYCECGELSHVDADFCYSVKCPYCGKIYYCDGHIELIELHETPDWGMVIAEK